MLLSQSSSARSDSTVEANCQPSDSIGKCVYVTGPEVSGKYQVETVDPQDNSKIPSIGVIVAKSSGTDCTVRLFGKMSGTVSGLTPGKALFVGIGGSLSHSIPSPGATFAYVQPMGVAVDSDEVLLQPSLSIIKRVV